MRPFALKGLELPIACGIGPDKSLYLNATEKIIKWNQNIKSTSTGNEISRISPGKELRHDEMFPCLAIARGFGGMDRSIRGGSVDKVIGSLQFA